MLKKLFLMLLLLLGVGMAVPSTRARIEDSIQPIKDNIGGRIVPRRIEAMANQLDVRLGRAEGLPPDFPNWLRRDYTGSPFDPWGNRYYLIAGRRDYTVGSMGPDGEQGTPDDITETRRYPERR